MGFSCRQDRCLQRVLTYFSLPIMQIPNALATHGQHSNAKCCCTLPHILWPETEQENCGIKVIIWILIADWHMNI